MTPDWVNKLIGRETPPETEAQPTGEDEIILPTPLPDEKYPQTVERALIAADRRWKETPEEDVAGKAAAKLYFDRVQRMHMLAMYCTK